MIPGNISGQISTIVYRVTHHVGQDLLLTTKQKLRFGQAKAKAELLF